MEKQSNTQKALSKQRLLTSQDNREEMQPLSQEGVFDLEDQVLEQIAGSGNCCSGASSSTPTPSEENPGPQKTNRQDNPFRYEPDPGRRLRLAGKYLQERPQTQAPNPESFVRGSTDPYWHHSVASSS